MWWPPARSAPRSARWRRGRPPATPAVSLGHRAAQPDVARAATDEDAVGTGADLPAVAGRVPVAERAGVQRERHVLGLPGGQQHLLEPGQLLRRLGYRRGRR